MTRNLVMAALIAGLAGTVAGTGAMAQGMGPGIGGGMGEGRGPGGPAMFDFAALDADGDGTVTTAEVEAAAAARFAAADTDGDGGLSAEEITAWIEAERAARAAQRQAAMIAELDANGDRLLQADELPMLAAGIDRLFGRIDRDGDGVVTAEEFSAAQERMADRRHGDGRPGGHGPHENGGGFWQRFSG